MNFPTVYSKDTSVHLTEVGSSLQPQYKIKVDKEGVRELVRVGESDMYAQIQSHKDSCDVNYILQRFAQGDQTALSKIHGVYGDFSEMPKTLAELSQRIVDAEDLFFNLPVDVREQFNHSPSEFFSSIGTDKFNAIFAAPEEVKTHTQMMQDSLKEPDVTTQPVEGDVVSE